MKIKITGIIIFVLMSSIQLCAEKLTVIPVVNNIKCLYGAETKKNMWVSDAEILRAISKKDYSQRIVSLPKKRAYIYCLGAQDSIVMAGTSKGVFIYNEDQEVWKKVKRAKKNCIAIVFNGEQIWMIADNTVFSCSTDFTDIAAYDIKEFSAGEKLLCLGIYQQEIWVVSNAGLYTKHGDSGIFYKYTTLTPGFEYKSIAVSGRFVAVGAENGSIEIIDKFYEQKLVLDNAERNLDFITGLYAEGRYIWIGSFDGLHVFDAGRREWIYEQSADKEFSEIEFYLPGKSHLYFGTKDGFKKVKKPTIMWNIMPEDSYVLSKKEQLTFFIDGAGNDESLFEYRSFSFPAFWKKAAVTINAHKGVWDLSDLLSWSERYELRLVTASTDGEKKVLDSFVVYIDADEPTISFDPILGVNRPGPLTITGRVNTPYTDIIIIKPFNIHAVFNRSKRTFKAVVNVDPGKNIITAEVIDRSGKTASVSIELYLDESLK